MSLLLDEPRSATVVAATDAQLRRVTKHDMGHVLAEDPQRTEELLRQLARRVKATTSACQGGFERMRVRFRGVRGSVPWSVPEGIIHGCNTPCIEIYDERNGAILVLDAGSGIVAVQPSSMAKEPRDVSLILTHYHWITCSGCRSSRRSISPAGR